MTIISDSLFQITMGGSNFGVGKIVKTATIWHPTSIIKKSHKEGESFLSWRSFLIGNFEKSRVVPDEFSLGLFVLIDNRQALNWCLDVKLKQTEQPKQW